jgi:hypothetical protein
MSAEKARCSCEVTKRSDGCSSSHPSAKGLRTRAPELVAKAILPDSGKRKSRSGYNVVFVPFSGGKPSGKPANVLTGFVGPEGDAYGNVIWRVTAAGSRQ